MVRDDIPNLLTLNKALANLIFFHENLKVIPAYLTASDVSGVDLKSVINGIASPDVKAIFDTIRNGTYENAFRGTINNSRSALRKI